MDILSERRLMDGPEVEALIAEQVAAGANRSAQVAMANLALKYALLTDSARAAWERVVQNALK